MHRLLLFLLACTSTTALGADDYKTVIMADRPSIYWQFENSSSDLVRDRAELANGHAMAAGPGRRGISGLAASFDRSHLAGRIETKLNSQKDKSIESILNGSFTIELWLLDEAPAADGKTNFSLFYKADQKQFTRNSTWFYRARQHVQYHFRFHGQSGKSFGVSIRNPAGNKAAGDGRWHHVSIIVDRTKSIGTMRAFLDGEQVDETKFPSKITINNDGPLRIGNGVYPSSPWQGSIDEFALYNRVLSPAALARHYRAGLQSMKQPATTMTPLAKREEFFELSIRPLLIEKCADCHSGAPDSESALSVTSRRALIDGGEFGPAIIPGRAEDSLLIHAVKRIHKEVHMPPEKADSLSRKEIAALIRWIDDGAVWPGSSKENSRKAPAAAIATTKKLKIDPEKDWALLPRKVTESPSVADARWATNPIDRFLEAKRQESGVKATQRTDRRTLIRRATFDLIGLPPTPQEVDEFLNNPHDDQMAFGALIDRLLASRHYGERAGRLWLDVARYADTQGDVGDIPIHTAYLYRNWVIDSLNADLPFDKFVQAQIAGDILAQKTSDQRAARGLTVATGFISLSRRFGNTKKDDIHLTIEDTIDTIGRGILGLTLRCSRCHDHKFDPILNTDYYGLYGIFESTVYPWMGMSNEKSPSDLSPSVPNPVSSKQATEYWALITRYEYQINNHFRPWLKPTLTELNSVTKKIAAAESQPQSRTTEFDTLKKRRDELLRFRGGRFRELMLHGLNWIKKEKQRLAENPPVEFVFAVAEGKPRDARLHQRGNPRQLGSVVPRRFLQAVDGKSSPKITRGSGRLELARWLTRPNHPLTARVIVNRVWQQHFGRGLVATADNFGRQGVKPLHPKLIDWLAETFVEDGWSLKKLHRRIMLTQSYQLVSSAPHELVAADADNVLVTRFRRRRLDAESIRDAMLAVSGQLDRSQGTAHPMQPWYKNRFNLNSPFHLEPKSNRRSVYLLTQRLFRHSILDLFDGPDRNSSTSTRGSSNVPSQALFLMNSEFVREQAEALAARLKKRGRTDAAQIQALYLLAYGRNPDNDETTSLAHFLKQYRDAKQKDDSEYVALSRAILTSNEFFFID